MAIVLLAGCATVDVRPHDTRYQAESGRIAVIAADQTTTLSFEGFARGKAAGALSGAGTGFGGCLTGGGGGCGGDFCGAALLLMLAVCGVAGVVGGIAGAVAAPSVDEVDAAQATLTQALEMRTLQQTLRAAVESAGSARGARLVAIPAKMAQQVAATRDYRPLASIGVDTVLETALTKAGTAGIGVNSPVRVYMEAAVRLVRTSDNSLEYADQYAYLGRRRIFTEWGANGGTPLLEELEAGYRTLGAHIYDSVFELYPFPSRDAQPGGAFGLTPLDPPTRGQRGDDGLVARWLDWKAADSLRPTLRWEAFPRDSDRAAAPAEMAKVGGVTYDLLVARSDHGEPAETLYRRERLAEPVHRLEATLAPNELYYWTVRARFELDGRSRVSEWGSMSYWSGWFVDGSQQPFWKRTAPTEYSYRFRTPEATEWNAAP